LGEGPAKQAEQVVVTGRGRRASTAILAGRGEGARILQEGFSEASVLLRKIQSFSDPRLYRSLDRGPGSFQVQPGRSCPNASSSQVVAAGPAERAMERTNVGALGGQRASSGCCSTCSWAEKSGFQLIDQPGNTDLREIHRKGWPSKRWRRSRPPWRAAAPAQSIGEWNRTGPHRPRTTTVLTAARETGPPKPRDEMKTLNSVEQGG